ncbi:MAG TPA: pentapeptide repeat-containing protein [Candidatus Hypogeohydataceae bacterium YC41]
MAVKILNVGNETSAEVKGFLTLCRVLRPISKGLLCLFVITFSTLSYTQESKELVLHFREDQPEVERQVESKRIIEALKQGVEKIDIDHAIIKGDLDFFAGASPAPLEESGLEPERIQELKNSEVSVVYFVKAHISITNCKLEGDLQAGFTLESNRSVVFQKDINFNNTTFVKDKKVNFSYSTFQGGAYFSWASFQDEADLNDATFKEEAIFSWASFAKGVDLTLASYPKLRISWPQLEGRLGCPLQNIQEKIKEEWVSVDELVLWQEVYLRLIKNFEEIGDTRSADDAYYHYRYTMPKFKTARLDSNPGEEYIVGRGWWEKTVDSSYNAVQTIF